METLGEEVGHQGAATCLHFGVQCYWFISFACYGQRTQTGVFSGIKENSFNMHTFYIAMRLLAISNCNLWLVGGI